jgi:hypothetical protein
VPQQPRATPPVIVARRPTPAPTFKMPDQTARPSEQPAPPPSPTNDFMSQLQARRAQREEQERNSAPSPPPSGGGGGGDPTQAAINRNLATLNHGNSFSREGGGGVFQCCSVGYMNGSFTFRGWNGHFAQGWQETVQVEKGNNPNIQVAIVKRMVDLIRTQQDGDFTFESRRLNRDVTLSARPADQAALEDFLMKEFFADDRRVNR